MSLHPNLHAGNCLNKGSRLHLDQLLPSVSAYLVGAKIRRAQAQILAGTTRLALLSAVLQSQHAVSVAESSSTLLLQG